MNDTAVSALYAASQQRRKRQSRRTRLFAIATILFFLAYSLSSLVLLTAEPQAPKPASTRLPPPEIAEPASSEIAWLPVITAVGSVVSAIGTLSTVLLGWRKEKRESAEFARRLAELEAAARSRS